MKTFLDSSAFAKRYVEESGSDAVDAVCMDASELALSVICVPEVFSALNRRLREQKLTQQQYDVAKNRLLGEVEDAAIINLTSPVIATCIDILEGNPIRAMDALHIACAIQWEAELFVSADEPQIAAAKKAGLQTKLIPK
jgi:predicted nucleic acid-binding protein